MNSNKIIHEGEITLGETIIPCYVLEDGTRVLSGNAMQNALNLQEDTDNKSGTRLARYLSQKTLQPFIYKDKELGHYEPIECFRGELYSLTKNGFSFVSFAEIEKQEQLKSEKDKIEFEKTKVDLKLNKWLLKTKWLPHFIAFISFIFAVYVYFDSKNDSKKLEERIEKIESTILNPKNESKK